MNNSPKVKGDRSEGLILAAFLEAGKVVLTPFGDNQRYDLVIDEAGTFIRIQCKTGRLRKGAVEFNACSTHEHRGHGSRDYRGQADIFGVYCPDTDKIYLVPVTDVPKSRGSLRVSASRNNQTKGVRTADQYEFDAGVAQLVERSPGTREVAGSTPVTSLQERPGTHGNPARGSEA